MLLSAILQSEVISSYNVTPPGTTRAPKDSYNYYIDSTSSTLRQRTLLIISRAIKGRMQAQVWLVCFETNSFTDDVSAALLHSSGLRTDTMK